MPRARVAGLAWPEFQLRQVQRAGALHIVVVAGRVSRDVVEALDRLRAEGLSATLVRTPAEAADLFHPDEAVLLMSGAAVVDPARLDALLDAQGATILCLRGPDADPRFELIDARDRWVGIARLQGAQVRKTAEEVGEWDFGSMLLRAAVRAKAQRLVLSDGDHLVDAAEPGAASGAGRAMLGAVSSEVTGWGGRWVVEPAARLIGRLGINFLPVVARFAPWVAAMLLVLAPVATAVGGVPAGSAILLVAIILAAVSRLAAGAIGYPVQLKSALPVLTAAAAIAVLAIATWPRVTDLTQPLAAVVLVGLVVLANRLKMPAERPVWLADLSGHALILLISSMFGVVGLTIGLMLTVAHGFATLAWLQNRLSPPLT